MRAVILPTMLICWLVLSLGFYVLGAGFNGTWFDWLDVKAILFLGVPWFLLVALAVRAWRADRNALMETGGEA